MSGARERRLARLEASPAAHSGPEWWAVQRWLGHRLPADQQAAVDEWEATQPLYNPAAPVDASGWSAETVRWWNSTLPTDDPRRVLA